MSARICALSAVAVAIALIGAGPASAQSNNNTVKKLTKAVTPEGVLEHLEAFQEIADENGGNRAAGLPGYGRPSTTSSSSSRARVMTRRSRSSPSTTSRRTRS